MKLKKIFINLEKKNSILYSNPKKLFKVKLFFKLNRMVRKFGFGKENFLTKKLLNFIKILISHHSRIPQKDNSFFI